MLLQGEKYFFHQGDRTVKASILGTVETGNLSLDDPAPVQNGHSITAANDSFYYWSSKRGLVKIDLSGHQSVVISLDGIEDWESYSYLTDMQNIAVNQNEVCALAFPYAGKTLVIAPGN